jgi:hypothetical protein
MIIQKPVFTDKDVWGSSALNNDIISPDEKIYKGWSYGDKPNYQSLNWFWNKVSQFIVHNNQNGVPEWDNKSIYNYGAWTKRGGYVYSAKSQNSGVIPYLNSRFYTGIEFLGYTSDIRLGFQNNTDLLSFVDSSNPDNEHWTNNKARDFVNMSFDELNDTNFPTEIYPDSIISYSGADSKWNSETWTTLFSNKIQLNDISDVYYTPFIDNEVLRYTDVDIGTGNFVQRWTNTYLIGYVQADNIINRPSAFEPIPASKSKVGGAKMRIVKDGGGVVTEFHIDTFDNVLLSSPNNVKASLKDQDVNNGTGIKITWNYVPNASGYNVYRKSFDSNDTKLNTSLLTQTEFIDTDSSADAYHVYYVTSVDSTGLNESYPSLETIGCKVS